MLVAEGVIQNRKIDEKGTFDKMKIL